MTYFRSSGIIGRFVANWILEMPDNLIPNITSNRTSVVNPSLNPELIQSMAENTTGEDSITQDDPWNWDIDRVVRELCTEHRSWPPKSASQKMPNPITLEQHLRSFEVDGSTLLTDIDDVILESKFGIQSLSQLSTIKHAIVVFRSQSREYNLYQSKYGSVILGNGKRSLPPEPSTPSIENKKRKTEHNVYEVVDLPLGDGNKVNVDLPLRNNEQTGKIDLPLEDDQALPISEDSAFSSRKTVKPPKRIAPTLITTLLDDVRDREIPTQADVVRLHDPQNIEPGVIYLTGDGKKRLIPLCTTPIGQEDLIRRHQAQLQISNLTTKQPQFNSESNPGQHLNFQPRSLSDGYLGKRKLVVDEIFYGKSRMDTTVIGNQIPDKAGNFDQIAIGGSISGARRLYVHKIMKYYLNVHPTVVTRQRKNFSVVRPYSYRLTPVNRSASLTIFRPNKKGDIVAIRDTLIKWPEIDPEISQRPIQPHNDDDRRADFRLSFTDLLGGPSSYDNFNPDSLLKYMHVEDDEVLPLYGESDEDGEYDMETWKEIEAEQGDLDNQMPLVPLRRPPISQEEITQAIEEGINLIVIKWNEKKLPKCQFLSWKVWKKARRDRDYKRRRRLDAQRQLERINKDRIPKMKKEILDLIFTSQKQVRRQVQIMEQTIYTREELVLQISVLESEAEPVHPPLEALKVKVEKLRSVDLQEGEESIETDSDVESSIDSLDDFVVDDSIDELFQLDLEEADIPAQIEDEEMLSSEDDISTTQRNKAGKRLQSEAGDTEMSSPPASPAALEIPASASSTESQLPADTSQMTNFSQPVIDLTMTSSDGAEKPSPSTYCKKLKLIVSRPSFDVNREVSTPARRTKSTVIQISDEDEEVVDEQIPEALPRLNDYDGIKKFSLDTWTTIGDRSRFLIAFLLKRVQANRSDVLHDLFESVNSDEMWTNLVNVMEATLSGEKKIRGMDETTFKSHVLVVRLFEMFLAGQYRRLRVGIPRSLAANLKSNSTSFPEFHKICRKAFSDLHRRSIGEAIDSNDEDDEDGELLSANRRKPREVNTDEETQLEHTPLKARKKKIFENVAARELREQDQNRQKEQDERRMLLRSRLEQQLDVNVIDIIINEAKLEHQGFIYVNKEIAKRIKTHQIEGVRFLWDQIVSNGGKQGCLLAHIMGLGKTMQTITLLVAIAEAAKCSDKSISSQIPPHLVQSRTLVLCPPGLINNWMDELLIWAPKEMLGDLRKIDSSVKTIKARIDSIDSWYQTGGVIIIGYEMFRMLVKNKRNEKRGTAPLSEEEHTKVLKYLQEGPNIVIADEAHKMKNAASAINTSASGFKTSSRIALTGSPLANNVEEYYTMVDWVARNYLGPSVEFRAKYSEPIQLGMYSDSSPYQRRKALKILGALQHDLAPKVHRADISVLRNDLKPKMEFIITVPLTRIQKQAYSIYVRSMTSDSQDQLNSDGQLHQTSLWHWLAILGLLCNHPSSFKAKLQDRGEDAKSRNRKTIYGIDEDPGESSRELIPGSVSIWKVGVSQRLVDEETALLDPLGTQISDTAHSNKMTVLFLILDHSRAVGDKVLIFSQSLQTLDYLQQICLASRRKFARLDGSTSIDKRQEMTKGFNHGETEVFLISTTAGGLGLNLPGANRVVILDFKWNPIHEEQAIGRAYRIGQTKPVYVYRLMTGGTFESVMHNNVIFKTQLASRVVDKKNPIAYAKKEPGDYLFPPKEVEQEDLTSFHGMDPHVLDKILGDKKAKIRSIIMSETFNRDDDDRLTAEEQLEVDQLINDQKLKRSDPAKFRALIEKRLQAAQAQQALQAEAQKGKGNVTNVANEVQPQPSALPINSKLAPGLQPFIPRFSSFLPAPPIGSISGSMIRPDFAAAIISPMSPTPSPVTSSRTTEMGENSSLRGASKFPSPS